MIQIVLNRFDLATILYSPTMIVTFARKCVENHSESFEVKNFVKNWQNSTRDWLESFIFSAVPESRQKLILSLDSRKATSWEDHFMATLWLKHLMFQPSRIFSNDNKPTNDHLDFCEILLYPFAAYFLKKRLPPKVLPSKCRHEMIFSWGCSP